jgi:hypothetical protein
VQVGLRHEAGAKAFLPRRDDALCRALGFAAEEAAQRAFLLYGYEVAESLMAAQGSDAQRQARQSFVLQLVQQPLAGPR